MSAVAVASITDTPHDFRGLVTLIEAAKRIDVQPDTLSKRCRRELANAGLAVFTTPPGGGHKQWFITRSYDPRLYDGGEQRPRSVAALERYTKTQRDEALQRQACVLAFREKRMHARGSMDSIVAALVDELTQKFPTLSVSRSQLYRWDDRYGNGGDVEQLVSVVGGNRMPMADADAWSAFRDIFLHQNAPTTKQAWRAVRDIAVDRGWCWCSYRACCRQLDERIPPIEQTQHRKPKKYRSALAPYIPQHPESWRAGECWIGDHKQLDLICLSKGSKCRPWLTAWMDWRTRKVCGYSISTNPNSSTILAALGDGLRDTTNKGGPREVWIDNGRDYDAWIFHGQTKSERRKRISFKVDEGTTAGIFSHLQINPHFSLKYNPNGKARLERWFGTLEMFCKTFETYTGNSTETKPERLNKVIATPHLIPTFRLVAERLESFITGYNASTDHSIADMIDAGERLSPATAFARWNDSPRVMADPNAYDLLLKHWHPPTPVHRNGITITVKGMSLQYGQHAPELHVFKADNKKQRRLVNVSYDDRALNTIEVYDTQFRHVCTAAMNQIGGLHGGDAISVETVGNLIRQKNATAKLSKTSGDYAITQLLTPQEQLAELATREREAAATASVVTMQLVQTPLDGQASKVKRSRSKQQAKASAAMSNEPDVFELLKTSLSPQTRASDDDACMWDKLREVANG